MTQHTYTHYWARHGLSILTLVLLQACTGGGFELATNKKPAGPPEAATQDAKITTAEALCSDDKAHTSHLGYNTRPDTPTATHIRETISPSRLPRKRVFQHAPAPSTHPSERDTKEHALSVAKSHSDIGLVHKNKGNYPEALEHYQKALRIWKSIYGENHPYVANIRNDIDLLLGEQGNYKEAPNHYEEGLRIWQAAPGNYPEQEAKCHNNLGSIFPKHGNYSKALIRTQEAASSSGLPRKRSLGNNAYGKERSKRQRQNEATAPGSAPRDAALATQNTLASFTYPPAATRYGFKAKQIATDSNCLFRAVADQIVHRLQIPFGGKVSLYDVLRHITIEQITAHAGFYKLFTAAQAMEVAEELMSNIAQGKASARAAALVLLSRALQITIVVIKKDAQDVPIYKPVYSQETIYLYYDYDRSHYASLYRDEALGASEHIDKLLQSAAIDSSFIPEKQIMLAKLLEDTANTLAQEAMSCEPAPLSHADQAVSKQHSDLADRHHSLGLVYAEKGNYAAALEYYQKGLQIRSATVGWNHPDIAGSHTSIGLVYYRQGNYEEALKHYEAGLCIWQTTSGNYPEQVADSHNSIGAVYQKQGKYSDALEHYQVSLRLRVITLGENHLDVADSYNNIGNVYAKQGDYVQALDHSQKALEIYLKIHGEYHVNVAKNHHNIGNIYLIEGKYTQSLAYYQKALQIYSKVYNYRPHPDIASSYYGVGIVYKQMGDSSKALAYLAQSLELQAAIYGAQSHPDTAHSLHQMGLIYKDYKNYPQALRYLEQAFFTWRACLGELHPNTQAVYSDLEEIRQKIQH